MQKQAQWAAASNSSGLVVPALRSVRAGQVTSNMLSLIERGEGNPSWVTIKGIAAALGVSVSTLAKAAERLE